MGQLCLPKGMCDFVVSREYVYVKVPWKRSFVRCSKPLGYVKTVIALASRSRYTPYWKRNTTRHASQPYMPKESHRCLPTGSSGVVFCNLCQTVVTTLKVYLYKGLHHLSWKTLLVKPASGSQCGWVCSCVLLYNFFSFTNSEKSRMVPSHETYT